LQLQEFIKTLRPLIERYLIVNYNFNVS